MPSAFFSSSFQATANNILNKFDNAPIYNTSTGAWSFKDSSGTEVMSVSGSGAVTVGSGTFANQTHEVKGNISSGGTGTSEFSRSFCVGTNYSMAGFQGPLTARTTSLTGTAIQFLARTDDTASIALAFNTNKKDGTELSVGNFSVLGAWTLGPTNYSSATSTVTSRNSGSGYIYEAINNGTAGTSRGLIKFAYNGGTGTADIIVTTGNVVQYNTSSDMRYKIDLGDFNGLALVSALRPIKYRWKDGDEILHGFFAQEVHKVLPEVVTPGDTWGMDYGKLTTVLTKAIQELNAKLDAQAALLDAEKARNDALQTELDMKLSALEARLAALESK